VSSGTDAQLAGCCGNHQRNLVSPEMVFRIPTSQDCNASCNFSAWTGARCSAHDAIALLPAGLRVQEFMIETTRYKNEEKRYG
jgi:hypothetical protein